MFRDRLRSQSWRVLGLADGCGAEHMVRDVALLHDAAREGIPPTLRFYTWSPPAVSLGRFQSDDGIDLSYARRRGWDVVRRPTGGRAVLHQHELTYGLALPPSVVGGVGVRTSYRVLIAALEAGIDTLLTREPRTPPAMIGLEDAPAEPQSSATSRGEPNCFALAAECDTIVPEGKLIGSAQARHAGALLQHGSILLDVEPEAWSALFGSRGRLASLRELLGEAPAIGTVLEAVVDGFRSLAADMVRKERD